MAAQAALNSAVLSSTATNNPSTIVSNSHRINAASLINGISSSTKEKSATDNRYSHGQTHIPAGSYSGLLSNQNQTNPLSTTFNSTLIKNEINHDASSVPRRSARLNNSANIATHRRY